jgi:hypothetical protein
MKAPLRTKSIGTKVSEEEFAALDATARAADMTLSEWVRAVLLAAPCVGNLGTDGTFPGMWPAMRIANNRTEPCPVHRVLSDERALAAGAL